MADHLLEEVRGAVLVLTLNRPDRLNALTADLCDDLSSALLRAEANPQIRAVVLTGAGRAFCSGADLSAGTDAERLIREHYNPLARTLTSLGLPVIAAINGVAAGAGAGVTLACDFRVAASDARLQLSFVKIGLIPDSGATWLLPRLVGGARAADLAMRGRDIHAAEALSWGLVTEVTESGEVVEGAFRLAAELAALSASVGSIKQVLGASYDASFEEQLDLERRVQSRLEAGQDFAEARSAFAAKRPPSFGARTVSRPDQNSPTEIR